MNYSLLKHSNNQFLAYDKYQVNSNKQGILFLTGYRADMNGTKAAGVAKFAKENKIDCIRFDNSGLGKSSGCFKDGTLGKWLNDALLITDNILDDKKYILIGSSMGGWIMLLLAMLRPEKFSTLIGLAAAPDFTKDLVWNKLDNSQQEDFKKKGFLANEDDDYPITFNFINEARNHLLLRKPIKIDHPVRLIHGIKDSDVPFETSIKTAEMLTSRDVNVHLIKEGEHRLSREEDFAEIFRVIKEFI